MADHLEQAVHRPPHPERRRPGFRQSLTRRAPRPSDAKGGGQESPPKALAARHHDFLDFPLPRVRAEASELCPSGTGFDAPARPRTGDVLSGGADPTIEAGFASVRSSVAAAKAELDRIPGAAFQPLSQARAPYGRLREHLRRDANMQIATNASLKFYEILTHLNFAASVQGGSAQIRAFCNAELPGAFVATLNHYARTLCPHARLDWLASSYYPGAGTPGASASEALGDQFGLYAGNRERWLMGPPPSGLPPGAPTSGDLLDADVVPALADAVLGHWPAGATLCTGDAGVDVSQDFNRQEELTALLNFGQVLSNLLALGRGGWLVTKQFAFTRPFTRSLIALVAALFDSARLVKPRASAGGNSEVYLVGTGFRGLDPSLGSRLLARLASYRKDAAAPCAGPPLVGPELTRDIDSALLRAARRLAQIQIAQLRETAQAYAEFQGHFAALRRAVAPAAEAAQRAWLAENPVRRLRPMQWLQRGPESAQQRKLETPKDHRRKSKPAEIRERRGGSKDAGRLLESEQPALPPGGEQEGGAGPDRPPTFC